MEGGDSVLWGEVEGGVIVYCGLMWRGGIVYCGVRWRGGGDTGLLLSLGSLMFLSGVFSWASCCLI